ncbi:MAG: penicillin-binding transpeptidase domain-containing protein, partial [Acidimicrobiales bacterium]
MDRHIRVLGVVLLLAFGVLFLQLNHIQVLQASKLANAPGNTRHLYAEFARNRGVIQTSDGMVIARSVPSNDNYKFQRQYPEGTLFADITGFTSLIYGSDGLERSYNADLTGKTIPLRHLSDLLTNRNETETVTLSASSHLQQVAQLALGKYVGAVVALNPSNGAILAMFSNPSYDPNPLASHSSAVANAAWNTYQQNPYGPMLPRAYRRAYAPGSTFK